MPAVSFRRVKYVVPVQSLLNTIEAAGAENFEEIFA